ncbi:ISL3 family transposase [Nocardia sp. CC216A]|uniref:ISL3 family transposase n=1 Tax=Nocardia sp. CC216A TaxID=3044158 RepID=UPI00279543BF|nr:ISL3 family transposase [Nocardia sp. CC216A]
MDSAVGRVRIDARTGDEPAACSGCGALSRRVHSRYGRRLSDAAITGREVVIRLRVRRLFCDNSDCGRRTFAEQVPMLAARYARRTAVLQRLLCAVALALGGRPGARMTRHLAATVSRMTLLRQIRTLPDPELATPRVLGVDDFALRRGHHYGTILIDIETRRPVDVLDDRTAATLVAWLRAHPGVEIVCRDRAGAYAEGIADGAPDAVQVADRWHIWHNLGEAVERVVARYRNHLDTLTDTEGDTDPESTDRQEIPIIPEAVAPADRTDKWAVRTRERYATVHALLADGVSLRSVGTQLGLARGTVRRFARAVTVEELLVNTGTGQRRSLLEEFKPYLHQRWNEGCTNATELFHEIKARGFRGGPKIVMNYLHPFRTTGQVPRAVRKPPSVRRVVSWLMSDPTNLDPDDRQRLDAILTKRQMFGRAKPDLLRKRILLSD